MMEDDEYEVQVALGLLPNPHDLERIVVYQAAANNIVKGGIPYPGAFMYKTYGKNWRVPFDTYSHDTLMRTHDMIRNNFFTSFHNKSIADPAIRKQLLDKVIEQL